MSSALPAWMYRNPELICDGLMAQTKRRNEAQEKFRAVSLRQNRRRIKALTKKAKRNGGSR